MTAAGTLEGPRPSALIREMKSQLYALGWCQRSMESTDGSICMLGALTNACNRWEQTTGVWPDEAGWSANDAIVKAGASLFDGDTPSISLWNDAPDRTFDQVIAALDSAEKIAELQEATRL